MGSLSTSVGQGWDEDERAPGLAMYGMISGRGRLARSTTGAGKISGHNLGRQRFAQTDLAVERTFLLANTNVTVSRHVIPEMRANSVSHRRYYNDVW